MMTTSDAIAISAACVGAGLVVLSLVIAVASLIGYYNIKGSAAAAAQKTAKAHVMELLDEKAELGAKLRLEIQQRIEEEADRLFADVSMSGAFSVTEENRVRLRRLPKKYPEGGEQI